MNNNARIDKILKYWAEIVKSNPNYSFNNENSCNRIYRHITRYDVPLQEQTFDLSAQPSIINSNLNVNPNAISPLALPNSTFNN